MILSAGKYLSQVDRQFNNCLNKNFTGFIDIGNFLIENSLSECFHFFDEKNAALTLKDFKRTGNLVQMPETKTYFCLVTVILSKGFQLIEGRLQAVFNFADKPFKPGKGFYIFYLELFPMNTFIVNTAH